MIKIFPFTVGVLLLLSVLLSACSLVTGIFKAGMGFGVFLVIAVIAIMIVLLMKVRKRKS